jgi:serine carboxypeptidase-like clade 2
MIFDNNKKLSEDERINFKGFIVGNPITERYFDLHRGVVDYLYYHSMISDELYSEINTVCNFTRENQTLSESCSQLLWP